MKAKEALMQRSAFPRPPNSFGPDFTLPSGIANIIIIKDMMGKALMSQSAIKAPRPDKINFQILRMI